MILRPALRNRIEFNTLYLNQYTPPPHTAMQGFDPQTLFHPTPTVAFSFQKNGKTVTKNNQPIDL